MDREAWHAAVHGVARSRTRLSDRTELNWLNVTKPLTVWITINWKILKEMGIPDHLTCLLRNLYAGQEATVSSGHGTTDWFQIGKGVCQGCILSPCLFNFYAEYIMRNAGLEEAQAGIKMDGQGGLACSSWGRKELDTTEQLNWTELSEWREMHVS